MNEHSFLKALASVSDKVGDVANAHQRLTSAVQSADEHLVDLSNDLADIRTEVADVAAAVRELATAIRDQQPRRRFWQGRRAATPAPVPDPGDSCWCVWQGGTRVETCPGHTTEAWLSRVDARLTGRGKVSR